MTSSAEPVSRAERKKQELRREIIDAAFDCFAERGYHATGMDDNRTQPMARLRCLRFMGLPLPGMTERRTDAADCSEH